MKVSSWSENVFTVSVNGIDGATNTVILPPDPDEVTIQATGDQATLSWKIPETTQDITKFTAIIRHSTKTDGTGEWPNSTLLRRVTATTNSVTVPLEEGEYLVKFENADEQRSVNAKSAVINLPDALPRLNIDVRREDLDTPEFQGQKDGVIYSDEYDALVLDGDDTLDDRPDVDAITDFDFFGTRLLSGTYFFRNVLDLGGKFSVLFKRTLETRGLYPDATIDSRAELLDRWSDFDGAIPDDTSAQMFFRTSDQATVDEQLLLEDDNFFLLEDSNKFEMESDINFGPFVPMESGSFSGRQFQFKCDLSSAHIDETPLVDRLGYTMQLERRTESSDVQASGAAAKAITFTNAFYQTPSIGIMASNLATGDYYEVTSATRSGFTVTFYNSSAAAIDRNFSYQAVGFGSETT
tara:strand:+ start:7094 stop:8323 length:1230 start_codon:yes stop_codon:yes gene_type:complete